MPKKRGQGEGGLYFSESRQRWVGVLADDITVDNVRIVTQAVCEHKDTATDSVGMAAYYMDSHNCNRVVSDGAAINEGDVQVAPTGNSRASASSIASRRSP